MGTDESESYYVFLGFEHRVGRGKLRFQVWLHHVPFWSNSVLRHRSRTVLLMCLSRCKDNEASGRMSYFFLGEGSSGSRGRLSAYHGARKVRTVMLQQIVPHCLPIEIFMSPRDR